MLGEEIRPQDRAGNIGENEGVAGSKVTEKESDILDAKRVDLGTISGNQRPRSRLGRGGKGKH